MPVGDREGTAAQGHSERALILDRLRRLRACPLQPAAQPLSLPRGIPQPIVKPVLSSFRENAEAGSLISYGFDRIGLFHDIAGYVDRIARGGKPAEMPIEQSSRYHLAVNMRTAAALGLGLPDTFVARADQVIE